MDFSNVHANSQKLSLWLKHMAKDSGARARSSWVTAEPPVLANLFFFRDVVQLRFFSAAGVLWRGYNENCSRVFSWLFLYFYLQFSRLIRFPGCSSFLCCWYKTFPLHCKPCCSFWYPYHTLVTDQHNTLCMRLHLWGQFQTWTVC